MKMQTLALAFLAATAIGGIAWVFLYPLLSGERKAEARRASIARSEPASVRQSRKNPPPPPRAGRRIAEGARGTAATRQQGAVERPHFAGWPRLVDPEILDDLRHCRCGVLRGDPHIRRRTARGHRHGIRRRLRPAALDPRLP